MGKETEMPRGERMVSIFCHLVRNKSRSFSVQHIFDMLNQDESVSLRNVQRDLKALAEVNGLPVESKMVNGLKHYSIAPDMRNKFSLPLHRNGLLAFFMLKRLQPFFAPKAKTIDELKEAVLDRVAETDYDLFEDLDEKLEESTFLLGEQSAFTLNDEMFDTLLTSLTTHRKVKILYSAAKYNEPKEKIVCPAKLILYKSELYFVCMSEADAKWDFYVKLCRILKASLTNDTFVPDKKRIERIEKRLASSFGIFDNAEPKLHKVVIRFPADNYYRQIFAERKYHNTQKLSTDKKGNVILTMNVPVGFDLVKWVLGWPEAEVVEPKELREKMREMGEEIFGKYGK